MSGVGGYTGGDALLALATLQQSNWNEQMNNELRIAKLQSDMASDLASIKSHLEAANQDPTRFPELQTELHAFMDRYGAVPELEAVTSAVGEINASVDGQMAARDEQIAANHNNYGAAHARWENEGRVGPEPTLPPDPTMAAYKPEQIDRWLETLTSKLDASGTSDQLRMIHIKQLNDNVNSNSGMVSGIIESRNNALSSIINNLA